MSNYSMYGPGYGREGSDSVVYRVDVATLRIDQVIPVGAVPKYLIVTPDVRRLLVSNWCSYSVSVVDVRTGRETARVPVGAYPRGLAVDPSSRTAYVAVMGAGHVAVLDLRTRTVTRTIDGVGRGPRHLASATSRAAPRAEFAEPLRSLVATITGAEDAVDTVASSALSPFTPE